ncbi:MULTISPECIES: hypothetical protein [Streptomyces]|uniref:PIN domain-containing protein n=1 Tax=Streptomyces venezuelae (strain ATCC 10712 / CBS 650.69 / DSM 40230 / JCM 4526 / NBRC 13096 / PD 04745) TaxID=953739 RepID=F2R9I4_STRVP|nr:hypothetical protein [Streptomyces venezuelae]APE24564.1 hypothetical protein vnz_28400 [Streptomyces venezuelae]CCA59027.1 hypothetical protein SVEN_5741 [Streptomyces venezuelae ATCC 10712]
MARRVEFVDTSILCNLLEVPGKCQDLEKVREELRGKLAAHDCDLLLPVTAVIETGNHIAQLADGFQRRTCAEKFVAVLRLVVAGEAPWALNEVEWNAAHLEALIAGGSSGMSLVDHAVNRVGCGDVNILIERDRYLARTSGVEATVWTLDGGLAAHT